MTKPVIPVLRRGRAGLVAAVTATLALLCCGGGVSTVFLGLFNDDRNVFGFNCGSTALIDPNETLPRVAQLTDQQMRNAAIIVKVGQQMQVPPRGWVVAVATALQESRLINLGHLGSRNDHDSQGLFQQRPSQGWGSPEQVRDPEYAARKFYERLLQVGEWPRLPLTDAAQRVQKSAYPDAYAKHEPLATTVVNLLTDGAARAVGDLFDLRCVQAGEISAAGWTIPVPGKIVSGFRTLGRPTHQGVDLDADRGTPIHAASAGRVRVARCNAPADWGCNRDGSPTTPGCGWYVDIEHAGGYITRYCHMVSRPEVAPGQRINVGQRIGFVGSSGRSSGPHLHFEVHVNGNSSSAGAINPEQFMRDMGAPLGNDKS
jgi:murein DD-endopeptidase MepM/ murein hydrolase activator NlpD